MLKRVFDIDAERCACGGPLKIIAAIEEPAVIARILTHLDLPARTPLHSPARSPPLIHASLNRKHDNGSVAEPDEFARPHSRNGVKARGCTMTPADAELES